MNANLINNINIQKFCLGLITSIHSNIFNEDTIFNLIDIGLRKNTSLPNTNDTIDNDYVKQHLFTFFLKGGNAMQFLERYRNSRKNIPFTFDGDFDCEFLINPELEDDVFIDIRNYFVVLILRVIHNFISELNVNPGLNPTKGPHFKNYDVSSIINSFSMSNEFNKKIKENLYPTYFYLQDFNSNKHYESELVKNIKSEIMSFEIPKGCPFNIIIKPNVSFKNYKTGDISIFNTALIKICTRTVPSIDLIDIAFPSKSNDKIQLEWNIHNTIPFSRRPFEFLVADPFSVYVDQTLSAKTNTRKNKINSRTHRARTLLREFHPILKARKNNYTRKHPTNARIPQDILKLINNQRV